MENKNSSRRNTTLDNFIIFSKRARDENNSLNFTSSQSHSHVLKIVQVEHRLDIEIIMPMKKICV